LDLKIDATWCQIQLRDKQKSKPVKKNYCRLLHRKLSRHAER
jgi:hypothetical protein